MTDLRPFKCSQEIKSESESIQRSKMEVPRGGCKLKVESFSSGESDTEAEDPNLMDHVLDQALTYLDH